MIYLIIYPDGRLRQAEQLTDDILGAFSREGIEILQIPCASGARVMELAGLEVDTDRLEWAGVRDYES